MKVSTGRSIDAMGLPVGRVSLLQALLEQGASLNVAGCIANGVVNESTVAQINDPTGAAYQTAAGQERLRTIATTCRARYG